MGLYSITLNKWSYLMRLYSVHFLCLSILSKRISNFQVDFISNNQKEFLSLLLFPFLKRNQSNLFCRRNVRICHKDL